MLEALAYTLSLIPLAAIVVLGVGLGQHYLFNPERK